jgi:DnaK suppressor protein
VPSIKQTRSFPLQGYQDSATLIYPKGQTMTKRTNSAYKKRLIDMREEIEQISKATEEDRKPVELDQSMVGRLSRMDALQGQAMQLETERRRASEIQRIDAALERIENDEFGYCLVCDEEIDKKRLDYDPSIPNCMACAQGMSD